jgi:hypothetical protein
MRPAARAKPHAERGIDARAQAGFIRESQEELEGFVCDAILRVIQVQADRLGRHTFAAFSIIGEELSQMQVAHSLIMRREVIPRRAVRERYRWFCHFLLLKSLASHQLAFASLEVFEAITSISSFHELTNNWAPSSCSFAANSYRRQCRPSRIDPIPCRNLHHRLT